MSGVAAASFRSFAGIAKEVTSGTPVAASSYIPVTTLKNSVKTTYIADEGWRGSMVKSYDQIIGPQVGELSLGGNVAADTIGFFLQSLLPDVATTGSSSPYATTFAAKNSGDAQPTTYTVTDADGIMTRQFPGTKFSDLSLKWSADGLFTFDAKGSSLSPVTTAAPTPSFSSVAATAGWQTTVTIGGAARTTSDLVLDAQLDLKRSVEVVNAIDGTSSPAFIWSGPLEVTGKLTTVFSTTVDYLAMLNNTQPSLTLAFTVGTGAAATGLSLTMTKAAFTAADTDRGKDYVTLGIDFEARANTTDIGASAGYSPIKATLTNALASGTYA